MENPFNILNNLEPIKSLSIDDTRKIGRDIASKLRSGDVLAISGEFGAGKTHLLKSVCHAFGIDESQVTSPSFTLIHEYQTKEQLFVHIDTYRLGSDDEYELLDVDEYLNNGAIVLMEWADKVGHLLAKKHTHFVKVEITGEFTRNFYYRKG